MFMASQPARGPIRHYLTQSRVLLTSSGSSQSRAVTQPLIPAGIPANTTLLGHYSGDMTVSFWDIQGEAQLCLHPTIGSPREL